MTLEQQILHILSHVGERGISVSSLTKHVYNHCNTLFYQPDFQQIYTLVQQYLLKISKSSHALIENAGRRGYYRLNTQGSADARQLMLNFLEEQPDEGEMEAEKPTQDLSLCLFDDF